MDGTEKAESPEFRWLKKRGVGVGKKDIKFYESFTYDGMDYTLFDCVYLYEDNESEPHIGKLIKIWELPNNTKLIKTLWFFRPAEISKWLKGDNFVENELFLACGEGIGLANINTLETIAGKCNVICTSKDTRNRQPSEEELRKADYIFFRAFDVGLCKIIDTIQGDIASVDVKNLFNRREIPEIDKSAEKSNGSAGLPDKMQPPSKQVTQKVKKDVDHNEILLNKSAETKATLKDVDSGHVNVKGEHISNEDTNEESNIHIRSDYLDTSLHEKRKSEDMPQTETCSSKRIKSEDKVPKLSNGKLLKVPSESSMDDSIKVDGRPFDITRRLEADKNKWFRGQPWEERMQGAHKQGSLIMIGNLDPACTSEEVEDIIWHGFKEACTAKMLLRTTYYTPNSGQALVVLKARESAENIINRLDNGCLLLSNGRPLVASIANPCFSEKLSPFVGHITIDDVKLMMQKELKMAVSTSHCSQPNTIEYEMAMEWCLYQSRSDICWNRLFQKHEDELMKLMAKLKFK